MTQTDAAKSESSSEKPVVVQRQAGAVGLLSTQHLPPVSVGFAATVPPAPSRGPHTLRVIGFQIPERWQ